MSILVDSTREKLGDQCKVVFAVILNGTSWDILGGETKRDPSHIHLAPYAGRIREILSKDDVSLFS
jgi:hypothetical protein